jgi:hypothetical protein
MIEGKTPMCFVIEKFGYQGFSGVAALLHRCMKLY